MSRNLFTNYLRWLQSFSDDFNPSPVALSSSPAASILLRWLRLLLGALPHRLLRALPPHVVCNVTRFPAACLVGIPPSTNSTDPNHPHPKPLVLARHDEGGALADCKG
ncbi:hypothetical protein ACSQ67_006301 [Phaseolus vulgaris]